MTADKRPRRRFDGPAGIALATAVVALISGGLSLLLQFFPGCQADPRERVSGGLAIDVVETRVSLGEYARRTARPRQLEQRTREVVSDTGIDLKRASPAEIDQRLSLVGTLFYVRASLEGFRGEKIQVRGRLYQASDGRPLPADGGDVETTTYTFPTRTLSDNVVVLAWVAYADRPERMYGRFTLSIAESNVMLAVANSKPFRE